VFVELDTQSTAHFSTKAARTIVRHFANAPVENPDGRTGIRLHLVYDDEIEGSSVVDWDEFKQIRHHNFDRSGWGYHYALIVDDPRHDGNKINGLGVEGSFLVRRQASANDTGSVFMHELGHSMGLSRHDYHGIDSRQVPFEQYTSVMNYNAPAPHYGYASDSPFDEWGHLERHLSTPSVDQLPSESTGDVGEDDGSVSAVLDAVHRNRSAP
jgi:hypothetical protein